MPTGVQQRGVDRFNLLAKRVDHRMTKRHQLVKQLIKPTLSGLCLCAAVSSARSAEPPPQDTVRVLTVSNGQEVLVEQDGQGRAVRLSCLQAPRPEQQPWAAQATEALKTQLPQGSTVILELRARDVYGRLVGRLLSTQGSDMQRSSATDSIDIAEALIRQGHVFVHDGYLGRCNDLPYRRLEAEAKTDRLGIWRETGGIPRPWDLQEAERDDGIAP